MKRIETKTGKTDYVLGEQIKGISGASAGSITAGLLASGFTLFELIEFSNNSALLRSFYDLAKPRGILSLDDGIPGCMTYLHKQDPLTDAILQVIFDLLTNKVTWMSNSTQLV